LIFATSSISHAPFLPKSLGKSLEDVEGVEELMFFAPSIFVDVIKF